MSSVESPERVRFRAEVRSLELQLRAIANAPVPRRAGALRSDGKRAGVHARWRWNAKHIRKSALQRLLRNARTAARFWTARPKGHVPVLCLPCRLALSFV